MQGTVQNPPPGMYNWFEFDWYMEIFDWYFNKRDCFEAYKIERGCLFNGRITFNFEECFEAKIESWAMWSLSDEELVLKQV